MRQKSGLHSHSLQKKGKRAAAIRMKKCKIAIRINMCVCLCLHEMDVNESRNISQYHERELEYHPSGASDGHFNLNALSAATQYGGSSRGVGQLDERRCSAATSPENQGSNDPRAQQQKVQQTVNSKKRQENPPAHMKATSS